MIEIRLPKPGPEIENATITRWESKEGDKIQIGDILAIIKTPIGSFKVAAEEQGILEDILQKEGATIEFDDPIAIMRPDLMIADYPASPEQDEESLPLPIDENNAQEQATEEPEKPEQDEDEPIQLERPIKSLDSISFEDDSEYDEPDPADQESSEQSAVIEFEPQQDHEPLHLQKEDERIEEETIQEDAAYPVDGIVPEPTDNHDLEFDKTTDDLDLESDQEEPTSDISEATLPFQLAKPAIEISPAAKKMAERAGIDIATVTGTGDHGKVLYIDIENAIVERDNAHEKDESVEPTSVPEHAENAEEEAQNEGPTIETVESEEPDETPQEDFETEETPSPATITDDDQQMESEVQSAETPFEPELETQQQPETFKDETQQEGHQLNAEQDAENEVEQAFPTEQAAHSEDAITESEDNESSLENESLTEEPDLSPSLLSNDATETPPEFTQEADNGITWDETTASIAPPQPQETEINMMADGGSFPDYEEISAQFNLSKRDDLVIPFNSNKKSFSETQLESNRNVPHFYLFADIDLTDGQKWLADHNQKNVSKVTLTDLIVKATGQALAMMPEMNAFVRNDRMILKRSINIGITTAIDEGVVTPVIPDVYHKSIHKISDVVKKNVELATKTKVVLDYDTTFTVTILNEPGIKRIVPLITPPQTGCLAIGDLEKKIVPKDDFIAIRDIMEVTLACDSRAIDPNNAAKFLQSIREYLESLKQEQEDPDWLKGNEQLRLI